MRTLTLKCSIIIFCVSQILAKNYRTSLSNDAVIQRILHNLSQKYHHSYLKHTNDGGHFEFVQQFPRQYGGLNKVLVKRKVPHGQRNTGIEHNPNYRGWYRPLYKVSRKPDDNNFDTIVLTHPPSPSIKKTSKKRTLYSNILKFLTKNHLRSQDEEKKTVSKLVIDIRTLLENPPKEIRVPLKEGGIVESVLKKLGYKTKLRMPDGDPNERSGEINDLYSPGKLPQTIAAEASEEQKKQKKNTFWLPEYSAWNYWTYHKPMVQDDCPLNQIKVNRICIWAPPHRRK